MDGFFFSVFINVEKNTGIILYIRYIKHLIMKLTFALFMLMVPFFLKGQTYENAESAEYDPVNNQWLVSNGTNIIADDGEGNLSFFWYSFCQYRYRGAKRNFVRRGWYGHRWL